MDVTPLCRDEEETILLIQSDVRRGRKSAARLSGQKSYQKYNWGYKNLMEQHTFKNVNNSWNTLYLETSGGQSYNLYLNAAHFFNATVQ